MNNHIAALERYNKNSEAYFGGTLEKLSWALEVETSPDAKLVLIIFCAKMGSHPSLGLRLPHVRKLCGFSHEAHVLMAVDRLLSERLLFSESGLKDGYLVLAPNFYGAIEL